MKHMKRSMFISTILMVVVLVVALSTATFAWYTASNTGSASTGNLVAADSSAANIAVGWTNDATTTSITFAAAPVTVDPMVPVATPSLESESKTTYDSLTFKTAPMDATGKFGTVVGATPWTVSNAQVGTDGEAGYIAAGTKSSFFVINHNVNASATVKMKCSIPADDGADVDPVVYGNADKLVVAVFVNGDLAGIFTNKTDYTVGPVNSGAEASALSASTVGITNEISIPLAAEVKSGTGHFAEITVKAWLDGADLTQ